MSGKSLIVKRGSTFKGGTIFTTENIKTYLLDAYPDIDGEKRLIKLRCYVNPVSYELCQEVDPAIAQALFHKLGEQMAPRSILNHCRFSSQIGPHSFAYCRDPEHGNSRVFIPAVNISKLEAGKVTPESNDFALMFTVSFDKNDPKVLNDLSDLMHEHFYITFAELQPSLFDNPDPYADMVCRLCEGAKGQVTHVSKDRKTGYCEADHHNAEPEERIERVKDPIKAAAAIAEMQREPGDESENEPNGKDPLEEGINQRNQMSRRKKK